MRKKGQACNDDAEAKATIVMYQCDVMYDTRIERPVHRASGQNSLFAPCMTSVPFLLTFWKQRRYDNHPAHFLLYYYCNIYLQVIIIGIVSYRIATFAPASIV